MTDLNPRYGDACDPCLIRIADRPAPAPLIGICDGDALIAGYRCPACGHQWVTTWALVPGRTLPPEPGPAAVEHLPELAARVSELAAMNRAHRTPARPDAN
ncbi:hypothetical protein [Streptomyces sp. 184]|uniref:hypothetical protein n=1 Tax=Streptomyces sp. 184 TaxID=1827526 RepID=UPI003892A849